LSTTIHGNSAFGLVRHGLQLRQQRQYRAKRQRDRECRNRAAAPFAEAFAKKGVDQHADQREQDGKNN
jgi:hypothetical protein